MSALDDRNWLIQKEGAVAGPYSIAQLRQRASSGQLPRTTPIKAASSASWSIASQFPAIFDSSLDSKSPRTETGHATNRQSMPTLRPTPAGQPARPAEREAAGQPVKQAAGQAGFPPASQARPAGSLPPAIGKPVTHITANAAIAIGLIASASLVALVVVAVTLIRLAQPDTNPTAANTPGASTPPDASNTLAVANAPESIASPSPREPSLRDPLTTSVPSSQSNASTTYSTEELVARTQASVAIIATTNGSGSGFMITPQVLATNYHVIADAPSDSFEVYFPDAFDQNIGPFEARLVRESPDRDLALLRIDAELPALEVDQDYVFRRGQDVVIIGSPGLFKGQNVLPNAVTKGVLSSQTTLTGQEVHQLSLAVNPGNSGGPVLGMDGRVIGVVVAKSLSEEAIGFSIPATELARLMKLEADFNYRTSQEADAMHDARLTVRAATQQNLSREELLTRLIEVAEIELTSTPALGFVRQSQAFLAQESPDLVRSFDRDFQELTNNNLLPTSVRRELRSLHQRHRAIESLLESPVANVARFMNDLSRLNEQYLRQLKVLNQSFEIGRADLLLD